MLRLASFRLTALFAVMVLVSAPRLGAAQHEPPAEPKCPASEPPLTQLDLKAFAGTWYELAHYRDAEHYQQQNTRVTYTYVTPSHLHAVTEMDFVGRIHHTVEGELFAADPAKTAILTLRIEGPLGLTRNEPYHVVAVDSERFKWAIVSEPSRQHLWILDRAPSTTAAGWANLAYQLDKLGEKDALKRLRCTVHENNANRLCEYFIKQLPM